MTAVATGTAVILVLLMGASLVRVAAGPTDADRMLGLQLLGSNLTALALVLSLALATPRLIELALVLAALAGVTAAVFAATYAAAPGERDGPEDRP